MMKLDPKADSTGSIQLTAADSTPGSCLMRSTPRSASAATEAVPVNRVPCSDICMVRMPSGSNPGAV
jgi:hypothetical protein